MKTRDLWFLLSMIVVAVSLSVAETANAGATAQSEETGKMEELASPEEVSPEETKNVKKEPSPPGNIFEAISQRDIDTVRKYIVEQPGCVNARHPQDPSHVPLTFVLECIQIQYKETPETWDRYTDIFRLLVESGADLSLSDVIPENPEAHSLAYLTASSGTSGMVKLLLERGVDYGQRSAPEQAHPRVASPNFLYRLPQVNSPLFGAIISGNREVTQLLLDAGVPWDPVVESKRKYRKDRTMLHAASWGGGHSEKVKELI
ncbi:MAG: ankyrin repeat domain-containing protein, partial [Planctomycetia bacterium]|nr:ankyrin repeat domain-containing protein [Planctomycetia bacterium]